MKKKLFSIILVLCMAVSCAGFAAAEEDAAPGPLTSEELTTWAGELKDAALGTAPANDPAAEESEVEAGYLFMYPFGTLLGDRTEMTEDTLLSGILIADDETEGIRGLRTGMIPWEVISLFPNDNPELAGDRTSAILYLREAEDGGVRYGRVWRDGQRIHTLEYGDLVKAEDGWRLMVLNFHFTEGLLSEMEADGFEGDPLVLSDEDRGDLLETLNMIAGRDEYLGVKSSRNGMELAEFGPEDLSFGGLRFLSLYPDDLPGEPETDLFDNEDGTWLLTVEEADYEAAFVCDENGENATAASLLIRGDGMEGPRGVRIGDLFHEDFARFRHEDREAENGTEVLYGEADSVPRGTLTYGDDGMTLRYVTEVPDGRYVELLLRYEGNILAEIIVYYQ